MTRHILTLCCLGLLGGVIAAAMLVANEPNSGFGRQSVRSKTSPADDGYLECQHSLPLLADADETDDTEELSDREKAATGHYASQHPTTGPSPRAARFEAAIQHRLANTLNALGVRLQI